MSTPATVDLDSTDHAAIAAKRVQVYRVTDGHPSWRAAACHVSLGLMPSMYTAAAAGLTVNLSFGLTLGRNARIVSYAGVQRSGNISKVRPVIFVGYSCRIQSDTDVVLSIF